MISFDCKIKVKHNFKNIDAIIKKLPQVAKEITDDILNNIRGYAIRLEKGHKEEGIIVEMVDMSTKTVKGRVYADPAKFMTENGQSYLWFEYFGTGQYAEKKHIGKTKHFLETGYTEWYIPVHKVGRSLNFPIIECSEVPIKYKSSPSILYIMASISSKLITPVTTSDLII